MIIVEFKLEIKFDSKIKSHDLFTFLINRLTPINHNNESNHVSTIFHREQWVIIAEIKFEIKCHI